MFICLATLKTENEVVRYNIVTEKKSGFIFKNVTHKETRVEEPLNSGFLYL